MADVHDPLRAARSDVLDAFARLECTISVALRAAAKPCSSGATLGQKIKHLKDSGKATSLPPDFAVELEQLLAVRNDMVHSVVRFANMKGGPAAIYTNAASNTVVPISRIANVQMHERLVQIVSEAATQIAA